MEHHRPARIRLPNLRVHASLHVTVENQVLLGEETPVAAALLRLMGEVSTAMTPSMRLPRCRRA